MAKDRRSSTLRWVSRKVVASETNTPAIGSLAFEISSLMSKLVQLWNRLEDKEFTRVKEELTNSPGIRNLVSEDEQHVLNLFLKEIVDDLQYIGKSIMRFGKRCSDPVLREFEQFVRDPLRNDFNWFGWQYRWKKMQRRMNKMQRFVKFTAELTHELDSLAAVERTARRLPEIFAVDGGRLLKYEQKVSWHRRRVKNLQELSPWNRSFDYILRLFMRSIITIIERIKLVFEVNQMPFSAPAPTTPAGTPAARNAHARNRKLQRTRIKLSTKVAEGKNSSELIRIRSFKLCTDVGSGGSPVVNGCRPIHRSSSKLNNYVSAKDFEKDEPETLASSPRRINGCHYSISSFFSKDDSPNPPPSTLGGAGLAVHYAKMIVLIEKFATAPHLIGGEEREKLFNMLPAAMRLALRSRLKSAAKIQRRSIYDPVVAGEWKSAMNRILRWLAPVGHCTETWHSERSFEKQQLRSRSPALLVQTLHYANKEKTEGALMELLVALSNICSNGEECRKRLTGTDRSSESRRTILQRNDELAFDSVDFLLSNSDAKLKEWDFKQEGTKID